MSNAFTVHNPIAQEQKQEDNESEASLGYIVILGYPGLYCEILSPKAKKISFISNNQKLGSIRRSGGALRGE